MPKPKTPTRGTVARPPSEQLAAILRARGLSSYAFEKLSGVDHGTIRRFLSGEQDLRLASVDRLAAALGLELVERTRPRARPVSPRGLEPAGSPGPSPDPGPGSYDGDTPADDEILDVEDP